MATTQSSSNNAEPTAAPPGSQWVLLGLTLLLIAFAVFQFVYLVPRSVYFVQHFLGHWSPTSLRTLARIPEWASAVAGLLLGACAVLQRTSLRRLTLLALVAVAVNVGVLVAILSGLVQVVSRGG